METQTFIIIFIGFSFLVIIIFGLDIYYLTIKTKEEIEEKGVESLKFSEKFLPELEKTINLETKKNISEINQKISEQVINSYQKQTINFARESENKLAAWEELNKKEILKLSIAFSEAENLILKEAKKTTNELSKNLEEKIDQVYQSATKSITEKIIETEKKIDNYEKAKIKEIDEKIYLIIERTAKKTIGKVIDLSDHEELVMQALEKAKKEIF